MSTSYVARLTLVVAFLLNAGTSIAQSTPPAPRAKAGLLCRMHSNKVFASKKLEELLPIVCEGQMASLGGQFNLDFQVQDLLAGALKRQLESTPACAQDEQPCMINACKELGARRCVFLTVGANSLISPSKPGYMIGITSIGLPDARTLFVETGEGTTSSQDPTELINKVSNMIRELLTTLGNLEAQPVLELVVSPADAQIKVGNADLKPGDRHIRLSKPGRYKVRVSKEGYLPEEREITCEPYGKYTVTVELKLVPKPKDPEIKPPIEVFTPNPARMPLIISGWSSAAVGAVLVGVGAYYLENAQALAREVEDACAVTPCIITRPEGEAKQSDSLSSQKTGLALAVTGGILAVGGAVAAIIGHSFPSEAPATEGSVNAPVTFQLSPLLAPSGAGVLLDARF